MKTSKLKTYAFQLSDFRHQFITKANSKKEALKLFEEHTANKTSGKEKFKAILLNAGREVFYCYCNGYLQPIGRTKKAVQDYINKSLRNGSTTIDKYAVRSNIAVYEVQEFLNS